MFCSFCGADYHVKNVLPGLRLCENCVKLSAKLEDTRMLVNVHKIFETGLIQSFDIREQPEDKENHFVTLLTENNVDGNAWRLAVNESLVDEQPLEEFEHNGSRVTQRKKYTLNGLSNKFIVRSQYCDEGNCTDHPRSTTVKTIRGLGDDEIEVVHFTMLDSETVLASLLSFGKMYSCIYDYATDILENHLIEPIVLLAKPLNASATNYSAPYAAFHVLEDFYDYFTRTQRSGSDVYYIYTTLHGEYIDIIVFHPSTGKVVENYQYVLPLEGKEVLSYDEIKLYSTGTGSRFNLRLHASVECASEETDSEIINFDAVLKTIPAERQIAFDFVVVRE